MLLAGGVYAKPTVLVGTTSPIYAAEKWNESGLILNAGTCYRFVLAEKIRCLADGGIPLTNLDGWDRWFLAPLGFLKRSPGKPFFSLIGSIDKHHRFRIQEGTVFQAPVYGRLVCYFNDWFFMYRNNCGSVRLLVIPLQ